MNDILTSLRRTPYQTFAAFSVLFITLLLSGLLFISLTFIQGLLNYVETRPRVIVYFQIKAEESEIKAVKEKIKNSGKASEIKYVSKAEAYNIYKQFTKNDPLLLEMTSADILPVSLEIDAKKPEDLPEIANLVKALPGVDEVQFQKDIVDNLLSLTNKIRQATIIFFAYLMFMSIIVLTTTTSFKIALKKDEINLLTLLGASKGYVRKPFILESVFLGLIATAVSSVVIVGLLLTMNTVLQGYFSGIPTLSMSLFGMPLQVWPFNIILALMTLLVTTLFSLAITLIASLTATNRYL
jgi:cell division transport system permease protein